MLSSDALSSVAYGPEAMLVVLALGGATAFGFSVPISIAVVVLMVVVGLSYRQTIRAYPRGGGSYIVASDNLGLLPGLIAAAGLMLDYILTVAVSVASGIAAITSAIPSLAPDTVPLGLAVIAILVAGNLRGVRQAGLLFAAPTYMFIFGILLMVVVGVVDAGGHGFHATPRPPVHAAEGVGLLLILRAFGSGATAMTGIEAISDGIPAFKPVEWRNARTTLTWMVSLLVVMFIGTIALIELDGIVPAVLADRALPARPPQPGQRRAVRVRAGGHRAGAAAGGQHRFQRLPPAAVLPRARLLRAAPLPADGRSPRLLQRDRRAGRRCRGDPRRVRRLGHAA